MKIMKLLKSYGGKMKNNKKKPKFTKEQIEIFKHIKRTPFTTIINKMKKDTGILAEIIHYLLISYHVDKKDHVKSTDILYTIQIVNSKRWIENRCKLLERFGYVHTNYNADNIMEIYPEKNEDGSLKLDELGDYVWERIKRLKRE